MWREKRTATLYIYKLYITRIFGAYLLMKYVMRLLLHIPFLNDFLLPKCGVWNLG